MALKRKREPHLDDNEFGSPEKKRRGNPSTTSSIGSSPLGSPPCLKPKNINNNNNNNNNDNQEEDSDIDIIQQQQQLHINHLSQEHKIEDDQNSNNNPLTPKTKNIFQNITNKSLNLLIKQTVSNQTTNICKITGDNQMMSQNSITPNNDNDNNNNNNTPSKQLSSVLKDITIKVEQNDNILNQKHKITKINKKKPKINKINKIFWKEIHFIDDIVPVPPNDLCDRYLLVIHQYNNNDNYAADANDINPIIKEEKIMEDGHNDNDLCSSTHGDLNLNISLSSLEYRIIKVSNFALGLKSDMFRKLLSTSSVFKECKQNIIQIKINNIYAFSFEILMRLLHLKENDIDKYLKRIQHHYTLIQLLILCDQYQIKDMIKYILIRLTFIASRNRPQAIKLKKNQLQSNYKFNHHSFNHIIPNYNPLFDNGGITLSELSSLLFLSDSTILCIKKVKEIAKNMICNRYIKLKFDANGCVDKQFISLPSRAINIILKNHLFCSWNENDVFLACSQWAANYNQNISNNQNHFINSYNNNCNKIKDRFNSICSNIRYHLMDKWFLYSIVQNYPAIKSNNKIMNKLLKLLTITNLYNNNNNQHPNPRINDINKYFNKQKPIRKIPNYDDDDDDDKDNDRLPLQTNININNRINICLDNSDIRRSKYDTFSIIFNKKDVSLLLSGNRLTSSYMVWHGIIFALDLVRKENNELTYNTVGVFLYCQGVECSDHVFIKYSLKTINNDHTLQCSDYKCMRLNFQRGNGSRDFFGCSWNHFLNNYFDKNNLLKFQLTFIDAK